LTLTVTSEHIEWNPHSTSFDEEEQAYNPSEIRNISSLNLEHDESYDTILRSLQKQKQNVINISSATTVKKQLFEDAAELAKRWAVGKKLAEDTIKASTQLFICSAIHPVEQRFKTKNTTLRYNHLNCRFTSDTFFANKPSILNNTCGQLFMSEFGFGKFYPCGSNLRQDTLCRN
jgi:hypothetical protein